VILRQDPPDSSGFIGSHRQLFFALNAAPLLTITVKTDENLENRLLMAGWPRSSWRFGRFTAEFQAILNSAHEWDPLR
jgi:hypothetical protein